MHNIRTKTVKYFTWVNKYHIGIHSHEENDMKHLKKKGWKNIFFKNCNTLYSFLLNNQ